jgi:hypothetical protein
MLGILPLYLIEAGELFDEVYQYFIELAIKIDEAGGIVSTQVRGSETPNILGEIVGPDIPQSNIQMVEDNRMMYHTAVQAGNVDCLHYIDRKVVIDLRERLKNVDISKLPVDQEVIQPARAELPQLLEEFFQQMKLHSILQERV